MNLLIYYKFVKVFQQNKKSENLKVLKSSSSLFYRVSFGYKKYEMLRRFETSLYLNKCRVIIGIDMRTCTAHSKGTTVLCTNAKICNSWWLIYK